MTIGQLEYANVLNQSIKSNTYFRDKIAEFEDFTINAYFGNHCEMSYIFSKDLTFDGVNGGEKVKKELKQGIIDLFDERIEYLQNQFNEL